MKKAFITGISAQDSMRINSYFRFIVAVFLIGPVISYMITSRFHIQIDANYIFAVALGILSVLTMVVMRQSYSMVKDTRYFQPDELLGLALSVLIVVSFMVFFWDRQINHDTAWFLISTSKWLHGARLYVELPDVNPPFIYYCTAPAIALANLLGISIANGQYLTLGMLVFISLSWSWDLMGEAFGLQRKKRAMFLFGLGIAIIIPALNAVAQRDHLLVIFLIPWFLSQIRRPTSVSQEISLAVFAMVGIGLKPYFILFPMFVTLWQIITLRSLRPIISISNLSMLVVGLLYIGFVVGVYPEYMIDIVPTSREFWGAYHTAGPFLEISILLTTISFALVALMMARHPLPDKMLGGFVAVTLAGLGSYLWQGAYWPYHTIPFVSFGLLGCIWLVMHLPVKSPAFFSAMITIIIIIELFVLRGPYQNPEVKIITQIAQKNGPIDSVMGLSTDVGVGPIVALELKANWTGSWPANGLVPGVVNRLAKIDCVADPQKCAQLEEIMERNRLTTLNDIAKHPPELLIVDKQSPFFEMKGFSWYEFLNRPSRNKSVIFKDILMGYHLVESTPRFDFWKRGKAIQL